MKTVTANDVRRLLEDREQPCVSEEGAHLWGRMDPETGGFILREDRADTGPGDSDLIDDLCELTLARGGHVLEMSPARMPTEVPVAAVLRY